MAAFKEQSSSILQNWTIVYESVRVGDLARAIDLLEEMSLLEVPSHQKSEILNGLAAVLAAEGHEFQARAACDLALRVDPNDTNVKETLQLLLEGTRSLSGGGKVKERPFKIAILSLLFNWPSTGGGIVHTYELAVALGYAGFSVCHIFAQYDGWKVGFVEGDYLVPHVAISFDESEWNARSIRSRFREIVDQFAPDIVIITDSWNCKPLLAEAVEGYVYLIRIAAMETLCPLNNVRLLLDAAGAAVTCTKDQMSDPMYCRQCVAKNTLFSGSLHAAERDLGGFHNSDYPARLRHAIANAHAVLVVNPKIADVIAPYNQRVHVVPSGFDAKRFPQSLTLGPRSGDPKLLRILFAGLTDEYMKGFAVLLEAGKVLWSRRKDFEIVATGDPPGQLNAYTRLIGWQSQEELPLTIADADILVFPTLAEEGLGRSAVEAMACGRPVVASRIGGLRWIVDHNRTGLLHEPGDVDGLVTALQRLLDDDLLRLRMGLEGRKKFESDLTWEVILERHYIPLFSSLHS